MCTRESLDDDAITLSLDENWGLEVSDVLLGYDAGVVVVAVAQVYVCTTGRARGLTTSDGSMVLRCSSYLPPHDSTVVC